MKQNRTVMRTVEILKLVSKSPVGITLSEICQALELPKTSGYDIVTTLVGLGMINVTKGELQQYTIGLNAYRIGINYTNNLDFIATIEPVLKAFAKEVSKTVFFGVRSEHEVVYISKFEPENPIITTATVGTKNPMYCTSLGKAILAFMEEPTQIQLINHMAFQKKTDRTILTRQELRKQLSLIQKRGYAFDDREVEEHMKCVGSPIFDFEGNILGAISVSGLYKEEEDYDSLGEQVLQTAKEISRLLGYHEKNEGILVDKFHRNY